MVIDEGSENVMTILKMRLMVLIERLKKVTAVANELGMKQPTVSFHMKKLEEEWGVQLFEHKTGKVLLTDAGKLLHHYALQIDRSYSEAESRIMRLRTGGKPVVRVGCTPLTGAALLTANWFGNSDELKGMTCEIEEGGEEELVARLIAGELDLLLLSSDFTDAEFHRELIARSPLVAVLPEGHAAGKGGKLDPVQLQDLTYVAADESSIHERLLTSMDSALYAILQYGVKLGPPTYIMESVRSGKSFTILPSTVADRCGQQGLSVLTLSDKPPMWQVYALWPRNHWNPQLPVQLVQSLLVLQTNQHNAH